jgi:hypothetical protein
MCYPPFASLGMGINVEHREVRNSTCRDTDKFTRVPLPEHTDRIGVSASISEPMRTGWRFGVETRERRKAAFAKSDCVIDRGHRGLLA